MTGVTRYTQYRKIFYHCWKKASVGVRNVLTFNSIIVTMGGVVNWVGETDKFCFQLYGLNGPQSKWKLLEEVLLKDLGEILENIND